MCVSVRCKQLRETKNFTIREMSEWLNLSPTLWGHYETGRREPSVETYKRLMARGVSVDWILSGNGLMFLSSETLDQTPAITSGRIPRLARLVRMLRELMEEPAAQRLVLWSRIIEVLEINRGGISAEFIGHKLQMSSSLNRLQEELLLLKEEGLIGITATGIRLIRALKTHDESEYELRTLLMIRKLLMVHLPTYRAEHCHARFFDHSEYVESGAGVIRAKELVSKVNAWLQAASTIDSVPDGDTVELLMSIISHPSKE